MEVTGGVYLLPKPRLRLERQQDSHDHREGHYSIHGVTAAELAKRNLTMANFSELLLEDPLHERELFASEVVGAALVHGNVALTFANIRIEEPVGKNPPKAHRVVSARLVLTSVAAGQLLQHLRRLAAQVEEVAATAIEKPN
jgi:hypothetical protein